MDYHKLLNYSNLFELYPQSFESLLLYRPNIGPGTDRKASNQAICKALTSVNTIPLILPSPFSLMTLEQIGILTATSGFGSFSVTTSPASVKKKAQRIQIQSGISRQIYLKIEDVAPIEVWCRHIASDWFSQQQPKRHFLDGRPLRKDQPAQRITI